MTDSKAPAPAAPAPAKMEWKAIAFWVLLLACLTPWVSPPIALALGFLVAFTVGHPHRKQNSKMTKILLQASVVGLGFGMNLSEVWQAGSSGFFFTLVTVFGTLAVGVGIGRLLGVNTKTGTLLASGTAICGGSAIAAVAPVIDADEKSTSISLATVFLLNSIALFLFPPLGAKLALTQPEFGVWSAIAIHDTSSVVGAAAKFGDEALRIATAVKLTRALWIVPLTFLMAALFRKKGAKITIPWFILFFVLAAGVRTLLPAWTELFAVIVKAAKVGLAVTLFLIGAGLSRATLKTVGARPLAQGVLLWIVVSVTSFFAITRLL